LGKNEINEVREQYAVGKSVTAIALDFDVLKDPRKKLPEDSE